MKQAICKNCGREFNKADKKSPTARIRKNGVRRHNAVNCSKRRSSEWTLKRHLKENKE